MAKFDLKRLRWTPNPVWYIDDRTFDCVRMSKAFRRQNPRHIKWARSPWVVGLPSFIIITCWCATSWSAQQFLDGPHRSSLALRTAAIMHTVALLGASLWRVDHTSGIGVDDLQLAIWMPCLEVQIENHLT